MALSDEQKRLRLLGYGASEVPTVIGVGGGSLEELYQAKTTEPTVEPEAEQLARDLGTLLEDPVAVIYGKRIDRLLVPCTTLRHPSMPLALATPDRAVFVQGAPLEVAELDHLAGAERLAEVKTTAMRYRSDYGPDGSSRVPEGKAIQAVWQMGVTGLRWVDLVVLFIGEWSKTLEVFPLAYNGNLFELLYEAVERFHRDYVVPRRPPPPNGSRRYDEFLKRQFPRNGAAIELATPEQEQLMLMFAKLDQAKKRLKRLHHVTKQKLVLEIGGAAGISSSTLGQVTYKRIKDSSEIDWRKVANDAMQLAGQLIDSLPAGDLRARLDKRHREIVPGATKVKPGYRKIHTNFQGEAALELARFNLMLEALEQSTTNTENEDDE
jgi:predicted phage-related endonuclease